MSNAVKRIPRSSNVAKCALQHAVWFAIAGLFVFTLLLTYGIDLSPGFY